MLVLQERNLSVLAIDIGQNWILHLSLLDINRCVGEHQIKRILVCLIRLVTRLLSLQISDLEDSGKELGVIHATLDIESVVDRAEHSIDFVQALREPADELLRTIGQVHQLDEVEEALQGDHLILFPRVEWLADRCVVLKVVM